MFEEKALPQRIEDSQNIPIIKPGKEDSQDPSKYRPISLLNIGARYLKNY
jgi:hypothetical protein